VGDDGKKLRLAAVQSASIFLDREASVEKACRLIREAGANGADVVGFPEGFIPAHPTWFHFQPTAGRKSLNFAQRLFKNAVEIPGPATDALCRACRDANTIAVVGVCERMPNTTGTMYNTQIFIDRTGELLGKHRKLVPTLGERIVHTGGFGDTMRAFPCSFGNISGLLCGENSNPLAAFVLAAMHTVVHVASWPAHFDIGAWMQDSIMAASRGLAYQLKAFVINAAGVVTDEMIEAYALTDEDREYLAKAKAAGAASIIGAKGKVIAGPLPAGEGILYADVDVDDLIRSKLVIDFAGHYNRFDVFSLTLNVDAPNPLNQLQSRLGSEESPLKIKGGVRADRLIDRRAGDLPDPPDPAEGDADQ
jgi:nitrilase